MTEFVEKVREILQKDPIDPSALETVLNETGLNGETVLSIALTELHSHVVEKKCRLILRHPKLKDFKNDLTGVHRLLKTAIQKQVMVEALLSDARVHRAFEQFSVEQIQELWDVCPTIGEAVGFTEMLGFRILIHFLKQDQKFTYDEITQHFHEFSRFISREMFDAAEKAVAHPDALIFCFGFSYFESLFIGAEKTPLILEGVSENEQFIHDATYIKNPLHRAASCFYLEEHQDFFQLLLNSEKIDVNERRVAYKDTALHVAIQKGALPLVKRLLAHPDIDLALTDYNGDTPLHLAMQKDDAEMVEALLNHSKMKAKLIYEKNNLGNTPLHVGLINGACKACDLLFKDARLTDFSSTNNAGETLLHVAVDTHDSNRATVEFLLQKQEFNINQKVGQKQNTVLHRAAFYYDAHPEIFLMLFKRQTTDVNAQNGEGDTAWHIVLRLLHSFTPEQQKDLRPLVERHAPRVLNDPRLNITLQNIQGHSLLKLSVWTNSIINFDLLVKRLKQTPNVELEIPDPEINPRGFASHDWVEYDGHDIVAYYAVLKVFQTENNWNLKSEEVFNKLKAQNFPRCEHWSNETRETAFKQARLTPAVIASNVFTQVVFLSDDFLEIKKPADTSQDTEAVLKARRFFRIVSRLPLELQMTLCNAVGGVANSKNQAKETIPKQESEPAFQSLALKYAR